MSSSDPAISVRHIAKFFEMYDKLSHRLWQMLCHGHKQFYHPYWALRDISFDVKRGECVALSAERRGQKHVAPDCHGNADPQRRKS